MRQVLTRARDIAAHLDALLSNITQANGYETDIGLRVYRGKRKIDDTAVPCAVLLEGDDKPASTQGSDEVVITQSYVLGGYALCDPDHPNDRAHQIVSDLKRAVFELRDPTKAESVTGTLTFGGKVKKVEYVGRDIGARAEGVAIAFAVIHIDVTFVERLSAA